MKTILHLIRFEWIYRRMRPATYIYGAIFFALGIIYLTTDAIRVGAGGDLKVNAPYIMAIYISIMSYFGLIITQAIMAVPIFRDWEHKTDTFLFSYPMRAWEYFLGRFLGSFLILIPVTLMLPAGMAIGEIIEQATSKNPGDFNPFNAWVYFGPYFIIGLVNFLLTAVLFFVLVALTRSMLASYVVAITLVVFYLTSVSAISDLDARKLFAQFDPFALATLSDYCRQQARLVHGLTGGPGRRGLAV